MSAPAPSPASVTSGVISAEEAIRSRRSIRAFLPTPVGDETVGAILELAARAPSGTNIQPWQVLVLRGEPLAALTRELHALSLAGDPGTEEFAYYPRQWREPYLSRRRKVGWDLYGTLGIAKGDTERMRHQLARNFLFFDAPVGLIFTMDRDMERGSWLDYGMFLQNIMIAARAFGLHTCPQAAFNAYGAVIAQRLAIPDTQMIVCSMALGFADPEAPENTFTTVREPLERFVRFVDAIA
ncbi:nitroreductase [Xanthobacter flavus]|uniref:Nitroreductase n=1 Tax=Xanthobacter flavus TaxID=281 RepID=A0A9W6FP41_XANFL|nr:nitroreductase [Xanthobacter flavus]MDR6336567.1 nitroreductase [Xanthobacter flavus]GLI25142.1 nitroreductase [Xanthobacter flavus]